MKYAKKAYFEVTDEGCVFRGEVNGDMMGIGFESRIPYDKKMVELAAKAFALTENQEALKACHAHLRALTATDDPGSACLAYQHTEMADAQLALKCDQDWWERAFDRASIKYFKEKA